MLPSNNYNLEIIGMQRSISDVHWTIIRKDCCWNNRVTWKTGTTLFTGRRPVTVCMCGDRGQANEWLFPIVHLFIDNRDRVEKIGWTRA